MGKVLSVIIPSYNEAASIITLLKRVQDTRLIEQIEKEIIARISKIKDVRIYEAGISYYGRTFNEGKKVNLKDGFRAIYYLFKYNLFN